LCARYSAVSLPEKPVAPYKTMSNSHSEVIDQVSGRSFHGPAVLGGDRAQQQTYCLKGSFPRRRVGVVLDEQSICERPTAVHVDRSAGGTMHFACKVIQLQTGRGAHRG